MKPMIGNSTIQPATSGTRMRLRAVRPEAAGAELLIQQASEVAGDEEEQRHAEDVRDECRVAQELAGRVVVIAQMPGGQPGMNERAA